MKAIQFLKVVGIVFFISLSTTQAQRPRGGGPGERGEHLKAALELTDEQWEAIQEIREDMREGMQALREEGRSPETREKMKGIMETHQAAFNEILNEEQKEKWAEMKEKRGAGMRPGPRGRKGSPNRSGRMEGAENMRAQIMEKRQQFEASISATDQQTLDALREKLHAAHEEMKAQRSESFKEKVEGEEVRPHRRGRGMRAGKFGKEVFSEEDRDALNALVETYSSEIDALMADVRPELPRDKEISEDKKAFIEKRHKAHFLLMDPSRAKDLSSTNNLSVYPNPSSSKQTLSFDVKQAGNVQIDIVDRSGNIIQKVFNGNMEAGKQSIDVSVSDLKRSVYFYRVKESGNTSSIPFVIQK